MSFGALAVEDVKQTSPLALLVSDDRTNRLLAKLANQVRYLRDSTANQSSPPVLVLHRGEIEYCRETWERGVLRGEHRLYNLASLLAWRLTGTDRIQLVARVFAGPKEEEESFGRPRIVIEEQISRADLTRVTDHTLSHRIARHYRYRPRYDAPFGRLYARASFLELRPLAMPDDGLVNRVMTRVKANEQIWNKVCDALFEIDSILQRDKILNNRSKYIKDVFGIKVLTPRRADSYAVDRALRTMRFTDGEIDRLDVPQVPGLDRLELLEHKDYLSLPPEKKKRTGWEALKNVYRWGSQLFELQIQTEANYFLEVLDLTDTSHRTFEMQRRRMRHELDARVPHYREMRTLLKFLFRKDAGQTIDPPSWLRIIG